MIHNVIVGWFSILMLNPSFIFNFITLYLKRVNRDWIKLHYMYVSLRLGWILLIRSMQFSKCSFLVKNSNLSSSKPVHSLGKYWNYYHDYFRKFGKIIFTIFFLIHLWWKNVNCPWRAVILKQLYGHSSRVKLNLYCTIMITVRFSIHSLTMKSQLLRQALFIQTWSCIIVDMYLVRAHDFRRLRPF